MAKKPGSKKGAQPRGLKAQSIRDQFEAMGRKGRPRDLISALAEKGIVVSSAQVSATLRAMGARPKRRGRPAGRRMGRPNGATRHDVSAVDLIAAKEFSDRLGGVEAARHALELLTQLQ